MNTQKVYVGLRLVMGFMFLWAFVDKLLGLGFATQKSAAWIHGGSPTAGFLTHAVTGPFASIFKSLAGSPVVDWLFMLGLLGVGVSFLINRYVKWGAIAGGIMVALMYLAVLPPANNPIIDEHIVYLLVMILIGMRSGSSTGAMA